MRVIAVDWSGDATARGQRDHIWTATVERGRLIELSSGRNRGEVIDYLISASRSVERLVVGLDFAFSFPAWFLRDQGTDSIGQLWDLVARDGEHWLQRCQPPFWGRPGTTRPVLPGHFRITDTSCQPVAGITPKSVFQIGGAGAVGTGSIRGIPYLRNLRDAGFAIWPFDPPGRLTVVEIYPRALTGPVRKSDRPSREQYLRSWNLPHDLLRLAEDSEDAFDAAISALVMSRNVGALADLPAATDSDVRLEGSIWVPPTGSAADPPAADSLDNPAGTTVSGLRNEIDSILRDLQALEARLDRTRRMAQDLLRGTASPGEEPEPV